MPDIFLKSQALDLAFHPHANILFVALLDGQLRCYLYDEDGTSILKWKLRPSKKSCRAIDIRSDGLHIWSGNKSGSIYTVDAETGKVLAERQYAHGAAISRIATLGETMNMFASGDDDGVVKLWDARSPSSEALRTYSHHTDYISDFAWLGGKKHLVATSGDGTLSVIDVRSNKTKPFAQSEDQEDELLSVVPIKGGTKIIVGTQLGPLTIFDRTKGYGDCIDRFLGHPSSVETMISLSSSQITQDVIATGSSDGLIRVVQIHPSKFLGVIAAHCAASPDHQNEENGRDDIQPNSDGFPIERMKLDRNKKWLGSISHDELLKLTNVEGALEASSDEDEEQLDDKNELENEDDAKTGDESSHGALPIDKNGGDSSTINDLGEGHDDAPQITPTAAKVTSEHESDSDGSLSPVDSKHKLSKKRKKKELRREEKKKRQKGGGSNSFFADL